MTQRTFTFNVQSVTPPSTDAPAWVETAIQNYNWQVGTWLHISGPSPTSGFGLTATNNLRSVKTVTPSDSSLNDIIDAWCGGCYARTFGTHGSMMVGLGGGHGSYYGNDVFAFNIATRTWQQITSDTSSAGQSGTASDFGEFNDGSPVGSHNAHWLFYDTARGEFVLPKGWRNGALGSDDINGFRPYGHAINVAAAAAGYTPSQWTRLDFTNLYSQDPTETVGMRQQSGGVWDSARNKYWFWGHSNSFMSESIFGSYDSASRQYTSHSTAWPYNAWHEGSRGINFGCAIDPVRDVMVVLDFRIENTRVLLRNLAAPSTYYLSTYTAWGATQYGTPPSAGTGVAFDWSPNLGAFVAWNNGTTVRKAVPGTTDGQALRLNTGQSSNYSLTWSSLTSVANTVTPIPYAENNGTHSKFRVASWGTRDIAFAVTNVDGAVSAFRLT